MSVLIGSPTKTPHGDAVGFLGNGESIAPPGGKIESGDTLYEERERVVPFVLFWDPHPIGPCHLRDVCLSAVGIIPSVNLNVALSEAAQLRPSSSPNLPSSFPLKRSQMAFIAPRTGL